MAPKTIDYAPYIEGLRKREARRKSRLEERRKKAVLVAREIAAMLHRDFAATEVYLFGSTLRPGEFHAHSDIDLAATGIDPDRYFVAVYESLARGKEFSVDLLELEACRPALKASILREGIKL